MGRYILVIVLFVVNALLWTNAQAANKKLPPKGYIAWCATSQSCTTDKDTLTNSALSSFREINFFINSAFIGREDPDGEDVWEYAHDGFGDCEDYAITKQINLINAHKIPRQNLLFQAFQLPNGTLHIVLVGLDITGEFWVMDNLHRDVVNWYSYPYTWIGGEVVEDGKIKWRWR